MNKQQAIKQLEDLQNHCEDMAKESGSPWAEDVEALGIAIEALGKQTPKHPIKKPWAISKCPSCNAELGEWLEDGYHKDWENLKVCECGQIINWKVSEV